MNKNKYITLCTVLILFCSSIISCCGVNREKSGDKKEITEEYAGDETAEDEEMAENGKKEAKVKTADYSRQFGGINGCGVLFDTGDDTCTLYNEDACREQISPCSTFKIVSALLGIHNHVIDSTESRMGYDQTVYPIETWNQDLTLAEAFSSSCVWYFRKVINEVGREEVQKELDLLAYGNRDIGEWEGNDSNPLPELNGFWLDSSLKISPLEQVAVLYNIFEGKTIYTQDEVRILKDIMKIEQEPDTLYGKTGTGENGRAWFVGFEERETSRLYFAVYLEDSTSENINGETAKKIARNILKEQ